MSSCRTERDCAKLHEYWNSLRGNRLFPKESEINPDDISDIWPSCFLISIDNVTHRLGYKYSYLGENLVGAYGGNESEDMQLNMSSTVPLQMAEQFDEVLKQKNMVTGESEFMNSRKHTIKYSICMVPLGFNDNEVSHILGYMQWNVS